MWVRVAEFLTLLLVMKNFHLKLNFELYLL